MAPWCCIPCRPRTGAWSGGSEILEQVAERCGYRIGRVLDLSPFEAQGRYLEGTGSLVLDHVGRVAFACRSSRTDETLVQRWADQLGYEPVVFAALDRAGVPFYHTNVMLSIGSRVAVVAADAIVPADRERVLAALAAGSRDLIPIDQAAVAAFAGNMLELLNAQRPAGLRTVGACRNACCRRPRWPASPPAPISSCRSAFPPSSGWAAAA